MKKSIVLAFLSLSFVATTLRSQSPAPSAAQLTVIRAGALLDGSNAAPRKNQLIFVRGNRIEKISDASGQIPTKQP